MIDPQAGTFFLLFCVSAGLINHVKENKKWRTFPLSLFLLTVAVHTIERSDQATVKKKEEERRATAIFTFSFSDL